MLPCAHTCTHTHTHTHTHAYMCTHTPWAVSHSRININALLLQFILFPNCRPTNIKLFLAVILFITCFSFVFLFSKLSCVSMCTFMHAHTYTPHTSTSIHLQLQSHVYCLCKFVFPCSGNYQQVFLLPFALLNIHVCMHMHAHTHTHTHTHTNKQTNKQTNKHTYTNKKTHIHKCKPPTLHSAWYTRTCTSTIRACWSLIHLICNFDFFSAPVWLPLMYPWPPLDAHVPSPTLDAHVP